MNGIFISYRRDDSAPYAGRLYDFLRRSFPEQHVFMDIDAIDPGEDFIDAINRTLDSSRVVLAVIGKTWASVTDEAGHRRLDNGDDYVVREIGAALRSKARVIPVLVGGAVMPRTEALPAALALLARRNAIEVSDSRFTTDAERLVAAIQKLFDPNAESVRAGQLSEAGKRMPTSKAALDDAMTTFRTVLWVGFGLGLLSMLIATLAHSKSNDEAFGLVAFGIVVAGFSAWFNIMLVRGKRWARLAYLAMMTLTFPSVFLDLPSKSAVELSLAGVEIALGLWALRMMFTPPVSVIFQRR